MNASPGFVWICPTSCAADKGYLDRVVTVEPFISSWHNILELPSDCSRVLFLVSSMSSFFLRCLFFSRQICHNLGI
jgi:hypothetical protein